jgi:hypothetical protein
MRRRWAAAIGALALHTALVVWLTWPLATHIATHRPNTSLRCLNDPLLLAWALAHESRALTTDPLTLPDANIYHPTRYSLFYGEVGLGAVPYFGPVFLLTENPGLALNFVFVVSLALTAWTLHLVVLRWTGSHLGGLLAGWAFLTARWVLWGWIPVAPNYAVLQYFPLIIYLAAAPEQRLTHAVMLLLLVVLQGLTSAYVAAAVLIPLGVLGLGRLIRTRTQRAGISLLATVLVAALLLLGAYSGYLVVRGDNPSLSSQTLYPGAGAQRLALPWQLLDPQISGNVPVVVPVATLAVIALGAVSFLLANPRLHSTETRRAWTHGAFWVVTGLLISLTPTVTWFGNPVTLPQATLAEWMPVYELLRVPVRLGVASLMGLAILTGVAFATCAQRLAAWFPKLHRTAGIAFAGRVGLAVVIAGSMYAGYTRGLGLPAHLRRAPLPPSYPLTPYPRVHTNMLEPLLRMLRQPGGALLELPIDMRASYHTGAMYRSIFHGRRLVNGYHGYWPQGFPERVALARRLPDAGALAALRRTTGLEMILVRTRNLSAVDAAEWRTLAERRHRDDLRLLARAGPALLFEVTAAKSGQE